MGSAHAATTPRIAIVQCLETNEEDWYASHTSSQALVGAAVLLGVHYDTLVLEELIDDAAGAFSAVWFSSCLWVDPDHYAELVDYLAEHVDAGGSVFLDGPLGAFYRDGGGVERVRGMDDLVPILGVDWDGWRNLAGYALLTSTSMHPAAVLAGYPSVSELTIDLKSGADILVPADSSAEVLLEAVSPFGGSGYPFLVVAEPVAGSKVAAIGSYGNYLGVASPFRNSPSPLFTDNQVLPYLLETLVWTIAPDDAPFAGLEISHAPVTMVGRLDGDWSDEAEATEITLDYLIDLGMETGVGTVYGIVSEFAEESDVWEVFATAGPILQEVGGSIGSHSRTHPMDMSLTLTSAGWQSEVAGSLQDIRSALTTSSFAPDAYAFINPGNTIRTEDYGQFFGDVELYLSHGFETLTPYSSGVQGFGLPSGVGPKAVINDVVAPDYQWLYASSWVYTVAEASALQARVLDYYQDSVGRGVIYNVMWHDYAIGGNAVPEHYPDTPSTLPLYETAREHFWQRQVYAPTVAEVVGKMYVAQGTVITSSYSGELQVDLDYADVPAKYRAQIAGMGLRIHQQADPIRRVVIDGVEHYGFSAHTIMMPAPKGATQRVIVEFGATPAPAYRLTFSSKAVTSTAASGAGIVASLARPGNATKFCFAAPNQSVVLGVDEYQRTSAGESCGKVIFGNPRPGLEIQPFATGALGAFIRHASRPLADAYVIAGGLHVDILPGAAAVLELSSPRQPTLVQVSGVAVSPTVVPGGFAVNLPATSNPGSVDIWFDDVTCDVTEPTEVTCNDGTDNDCDGLTDCADGDCTGIGGCTAAPRLVVITDVSDATVRQDAPSGNFGSAESIEVDTASVFQYGLIKPDHLGDIGPGAQVLRAELVFQVFNPGDTVQVRQVLGSWSEGAVTWNDAPLVASSIHASFAGSPTGEVVLDITPIAQAWVDGAAVQGLELYPTDADGVDIRSSEYGTPSLRPYFVLEVIDGGGTTCPGASEACGDGVDNDCDGMTDCADSDCAGAGSCSAASRVVVVSQVSDATVRQNAPSTNYGGEGSIEVDTASVFQYGLVKPDHLGDITPGSQVVRAELVLQVFNPGDTVEVREVLGGWSESTVTWNAAPTSATLIHRTFAAASTGQVVIDITSIAQGWVDGAAVQGLELYPSGSDGVDIRSSEYGTASLRPFFRFEVIDGGGACPDADADGHLAAFCGGTDCDDADASTHPGAGEVCADALDNDCDAQVDCADGDCSADAACTGGALITVVLESIDDAYVNDQSPNASFGSSASLEVDTWADYKRTFIKPNGLGAITPGAQVVSAQLVMHIYDAGDAITLHEVLSSWSESSLTWNNAPTAATAFGSLPAGAVGDVAIDVTDLMQSWVGGSPIHGVRLDPTSSNGVRFRSTEVTDATLRPHFVVEVIQ